MNQTVQQLQMKICQAKLSQTEVQYILIKLQYRPSAMSHLLSLAQLLVAKRNSLKSGHALVSITNLHPLIRGVKTCD